MEQREDIEARIYDGLVELMPTFYFSIRRLGIFTIILFHVNIQ